MTDLGKHIAFEMGYASLKRSTGEFLSHNDIKTLNTVCNHEPNLLDAPFF